jgi:hypothetical protein
MEVICNFFKRDVFSVIFIQAGISELKSLYYAVPFTLYELIFNNEKKNISNLFLRYSKIAIYRDTIQTNIMGVTSIVGAIASQFNYEKK